MEQGLETRVLHAYKDDSNEGNFNLLICETIDSAEGVVVRQAKSTPTHQVFQITQTISVDDRLIIETFEISCIAFQDKLLISKHEYKRILNDISRDLEENMKDEREESYSSSSQPSSSESEDDDNSQEDSLYDKRPVKIQSRYQHDSQNAKSQKKGRGRPKGSKNKKTLIRQEQNSRSGNIEKIMHLHSILSGKIKRGKGRPKGSKNKPKTSKVFVKIEEEENVPFVGKRGKGRPKGSKNKIKVVEQTPVISENKVKRGRGRPPGAKNRLPSSPQVSSIKQQSESEHRLEWQRIDKEVIDSQRCCNRCKQRRLRQQIFEGNKYFEDGIQDLEDIFCDYGPENKKNLALQILQENDEERLELLLSRKENHELYFKAPWTIQSALYYTKFEVKTKKDYLSQTGKEGIYAMFHDYNFKKEVWWKRLGVERIIESICKEQRSYETIQRLFNESTDLKQAIYNNLPHAIRSGNHILAGSVLKNMLQSQRKNKYNYSEEHLELLNGQDVMNINNYKKLNLIKPNESQNYCSPIHCAAITPSPHFMEKLLQVFTDVINVEDSIGRKPIHYASACQNTANLKALIQNGAELREFDRKKITPLMIACYYGINQNVEYILQKVREHSYINFRSDQGFSALHYAILQNHEECVDLLMNDPYIRFDSSENKELPDVFHIVSWSGNINILTKLIEKWGSYLSNSYDKFKKSPAVYAIMNHNNDILYKLLISGCRPFRTDTTLNTLLHYSAAYGNMEAIKMLKANEMNQTKNKRNYYPWQFAIMKGHLGCAKILESENLDFKQDPLYFLLSIIRGTDEYLECVKYVADEKFTKNIKYQDPSTGNTYLHLVCGVNQQEYVKQRTLETFLSEEEIREEFYKAQIELIRFFQQKGLNGEIENKKRESPLKQCIENANLIGIQKLLTGKISFDLESAEGSTIMHRLSNLACKGIEEMEFVEKKLRESAVNDLRINLKNFDQSGFDFLLYFVKNFTDTIKLTYKRWVKKYWKQDKSLKEAQKYAFQQFIRFQNKFMNLVNYLIEQGCDVNRQVTDKKVNSYENFQKWGIQHFLMKFPSLKLIEFFINNKHKIRYFHNAQNNLGMTPLHLFCKNISCGNLLQTEEFDLPNDYQTQKILEYLLLNVGLNPNTTDSERSLPILYAALNHQYSFINILMKHKSQINQVNSKNQVPLIEIIKNHKNYKREEIEGLLKRGAKPSFEDMQKRNSLHHLVRCSTNFDSSAELCKLLLDFNVKINSLDKYNRSPIFYCFDPDDEETDPNDKIELLQILVNIPDINLNLLDVFTRSIVHYACRKEYFFSMVYLLDLNINIEIADHESNTPLAICLKEGNLDQAALIIRKGVKYGFVNSEVKDANGNIKVEKQSYFGYAVRHSFAGICFMLLDNGYPVQKALEVVKSETFKQILKIKYIK